MQLRRMDREFAPIRLSMAVVDKRLKRRELT